MRSIKAIAISWTLWGLAYYLYSPYLTVFLKSIVKEDFIGVIYILSSLVGLVYAIIPLYTNKVKEVTIVSLILSGLGLVLLSFSINPISVIISIILYSMYWVSVPVFYLLMRDEVAKIWAISMLPALLIPFISENIIISLGLRYIFIISGIIMAFTAVPIINVEIKGRGVATGKNNNFTPLIFTILPLSISLPYLYIKIPLSLIPVIYAIGEFIGILMATYFSKMKRGLSLALLSFSLISTNSILPFGAMFYGISEALTALGVDNVEINDLKDSVKVTLVEISLWLIGYTLATALFVISPFLPTIYASLLAILFGLLTLLVFPKVLKIIFVCKRRMKKCFEKYRGIEGISPYFKFA
ncbi:hypothetical protein SJAV_07250 [Sulfurisphaera javensis]|uniref:Permease n=1 Tax=Sulfurisphaera javensis TaxID=2049879 RepID=A0AAT9GPF2_9CREN